jgi:uncharacterized protein YndB with AHSA1/START domain
MSKLKYTLEGDTQVVFTRHFATTPEALYQAHTECDLIQKWLLGPEGWTMPTCNSDNRVGGSIRFEWSDANGNGFHLTGEYLELQPFTRIVQ